MSEINMSNVRYYIRNEAIVIGVNDHLTLLWKEWTRMLFYIPNIRACIRH